MGESLTPRQEKFLQALLFCPNVTKASEMAGVARSTGKKYLASASFKRAYREHTSQIMRQTTGQLQQASLEAVAVLREIMNDPDVSPYARQQAAQTVLSTAYRAYEVLEVVDMVEEIKVTLDNETD